MLEMMRLGGWPAVVVFCLGNATLAVTVIHAVLSRRGTFAASLSLFVSTLALGLLGTLLGMMRAYRAVAGAEPALKASLLAQGISESMNATAFALLLVPLWIVPFVIGELRRRRGAA